MFCMHDEPTDFHVFTLDPCLNDVQISQHLGIDESQRKFLSQSSEVCDTRQVTSHSSFVSPNHGGTMPR